MIRGQQIIGLSEVVSGPSGCGSYEHGVCKHCRGKQDKPAPWTMPTAHKGNCRDRRCVNRTRATSPTFCERKRRYSHDEESNCTSTERECHSSAGDVEGSGVRDGEPPAEVESFYNTQGGTLTTAQEMIVLAQSMTATAKRMTALAKRARVIELQHKKLSIQVQRSKSDSQGHHAGAVGTLGIPAPGDAAEGAQGRHSVTAQPPCFPPPAWMMSRASHEASSHASSGRHADSPDDGTVRGEPVHEVRGREDGLRVARPVARVAADGGSRLARNQIVIGARASRQPCSDSEQGGFEQRHVDRHNITPFFVID